MSAMIASIAMYDWPELREATDSFYRAWRDAARDRGIALPAALSYGEPLEELWKRSDLALGQACGFPYATGQCAQAQLIATPCYSALGCAGPSYCSVFVARRSEKAQPLESFRDCRVAVNSWSSQSGFNALRHHLWMLGVRDAFFSGTRVTGSHLASMQAVAEGSAQLAAIDCVVWAHLQELRPALFAELCVVDQSEPTPGLPFICSGNCSEALLSSLRESLTEVLAARENAEACARLRLGGAEFLSPADYQVIADQAERSSPMPWGPSPVIGS